MPGSSAVHLVGAGMAGSCPGTVVNAPSLPREHPERPIFLHQPFRSCSAPHQKPFALHLAQELSRPRDFVVVIEYPALIQAAGMASRWTRGAAVSGNGGRLCDVVVIFYGAIAKGPAIGSTRIKSSDEIVR